MLPQIIGLNGKKSAGKDTVGAMLVERWGYEQASFARLLKESFAALFGVTVEDIEAAKNEPNAHVQLWIPTSKEAKPALLVNLTLREALQRYGTEAHREIFGPDFWVEQWMQSFDPDGSYVFTDARFPNELEAIRAHRGRTVRIHRRGLDEEDTHVSEAEPPFGLIDHHLYNHGDLDELAVDVDNFMESFGYERELRDRAEEYGVTPAL